jgi:hypothetical protein
MDHVVTSDLGDSPGELERVGMMGFEHIQDKPFN